MNTDLSNVPMHSKSSDHKLPVVLRMTGHQHDALVAHLYPGDGCEAVALALCGRRHGSSREVLVVHRILPVPHAACPIRTETRVEWPTHFIAEALEEAEQRGWGILKIHSHPTGYSTFSAYDDESDRRVFGFVYDWLEHSQGEAPHTSVVMLPNGDLFGRVIKRDGSFDRLDSIAIVGDDIRFFYDHSDPNDQLTRNASHKAQLIPAFAERHVQAFGRGTFERLQRLSVAVIGCSGTGSPTVEQLARLGVGELVLVDPDRVEPRNLNRITNAFASDADRYKVDVLAEAVEKMGTGTRVVPLAHSLGDRDVALRVAECDIAFGCMDSLEGRDILNRVCAYYGLAYFDLGVGLVADGKGGIDRVTAAIHYLQPDGSSLFSRGVYTAEQLAAEALRREDPDSYVQLLREKYVQGAPPDDTPAVISVNMLASSIAINELLARLHPYRLDSNAEFAWWQVSLSGGIIAHGHEKAACPMLASKAGRGDTTPVLDLPSMSQTARAA